MMKTKVINMVSIKRNTIIILLLFIEISSLSLKTPYEQKVKKTSK